MSKRLSFACLILLLSPSLALYAQAERGWTSSGRFQGTTSSAGSVLKLDPTLGYAVTPHFQTYVGLPFYTVNQPATTTTAGGFVNGIGKWANMNFANCHGLGLCGTCRVLITKGMENTNKLTTREYLKFKTVVPTGGLPDPIPPLAYIGHEETMRLACCTTVHGDIEVETGPELNLFGENFFS